ncbi:unnamed protein product [Peniophora sp. CBMAI 1063]|nr:unnamed protein product [Peniophora sp. CBMAI 1063]
MIVPRSCFEIKGSRTKRGDAGRDSEEQGQSDTDGEASDQEAEELDEGDFPDVECDESDVQCKKKVDGNVRKYLSTAGCRRDVLDDYYENPARSPPTGVCCDNCERAAESKAVAIERVGSEGSSTTPLSPSSVVNTPRKRKHTGQPSTLKKHPRTSDSDDDVSPGILSKPKISRRGGAHLADTKDKLNDWRLKTKRESYPHVPFMSSGILPDRALKTIASRRDFENAGDLRTMRPLWPLAEVDGLGGQALEVVREGDREEAARKRTGRDEHERERKRRKIERKNDAERENVQLWTEEARQRESEA